MSQDQDFGRHAWLSIADELSADPAFVSSADPGWVSAAESFARERGLPWPPPGDVDIAIAMLEELP